MWRWFFVGLAVSACTPQGDPGLPPHGFRDDFERKDLGDDWSNTGANYRIVDGQLKIDGARNKPLWLRRKLPHDVRIEVDVRSDSPDGDIKLEIFGDGVSKAEKISYTATSYVVIFGGWHNSLNVLARMDEHAKDRVVGADYKVVPGQTYHMKIERRGATITAWVDDRKLVSMTDPEPLSGPGHDHFAFN
ncbi:MAG TPA: family 16 glycoside hydrolase, partial [Polyangiales bacterium]|nr:family 16 glycoside hydrolase [Polyangiales bacterium]